jgi:hypothetical protein
MVEYPGALTIPEMNELADRVLSPEESISVPFAICLTTQTPFLLLVDIIGVVEEGE